MGLDTRAYAKATDAWKKTWVMESNEAGGRRVMFGLMWEPIGQCNYGLTGGYLSGRPPFTLEDAPDWHQDGLEDLPWPGTVRNYGRAGGYLTERYPLVGGMISGYGNTSSFRGKAYDGYVEVVTGHSLYAACDEMWQGDDLKEITESLREAADHDPVGPGDEYDGIEPDEREALATWFEVCVENDLVVSGDC